MLSIRAGAGLKSRDFGFANEFAYNFYEENVKTNLSFQYGLDYQQGLSTRSSLWAAANFAVRDIYYEDIILMDVSGQIAGSYEKDILRFIDVSLGYSYKIIDKDFDLYLRAGGFIAFPVDFRAQYDFTDNSIQQNTFKPVLPEENNYGVIVEPLISWKPWLKRNTGFSLGIPVQLFWVENPNSGVADLNPRYTVSLLIGVSTFLQ